MRMMIPMVVVLALLAGCGKSAIPEAEGLSVTLFWTAPTEYENGSPLTVAEYRLYYGFASLTYSRIIDVGSGTEVTLRGLPAETLYFAVTALDGVDIESLPSAELVVNLATP